MNKQSNKHNRPKVQAPREQQAPNIGPQLIWATWRRSWMWALPVGLVFAGIAAVVVLQTFEPRFRATHWIEANTGYLVFKGVNPTYDNLAQTEKQMVLNPLVLDPILANPDLRWVPSLANPETAETNLKTNLHFSSGGTRSRLGIIYEDTDPKAAAAVCNAIVDSYMAFREDYDSKRVTNIVNWLEPELKRWEQEVENQREKVKKLASQTVGYSQDNQVSRMETNDSFSRATQLYIEIGKLELEISIGDAKLAMLDQKNAPGGVFASTTPSVFASLAHRVQKKVPTELDIERGIRQEPSVVEAVRNIQKYKSLIVQLEDSGKSGLRRLMLRKAELQTRVGSGHPDVTAIDSEIAVLEAEADQEYKRYTEFLSAAQADYKSSSKIAREKVKQQLINYSEADYQHRMADAQSGEQLKRSLEYIELAKELEVKKSKLAILQPRYQEARADLEKFGGATAELEFATSELEVSTGVLSKIRGRAAQIRTERRPEGAIRSLATATIPNSAIEKVPFKKLLVASCVAALVPFLFGLLMELYSGRISDSKVCDENGLEVLGEVARLPVSDQSSRGRRVFEESVDTLRAGLFLSLETRGTRSLSVVSSVSGEGKSSVSSQLALSIAKATGKTVLLVDADLRCPDQHHIFRLELGPGLSAVLSHAVPFNEAVDRSHGDLIHILPAGKLTESPHRLLTAKRMKSFVQAALKKYAYVVIDTSPVLSAGESIAVAAATDASLMCVMRDVSRLDSVKKTQRRLEAAGANLVGTVFSGVSARQYAYRYGDYHYSLAGAVDSTPNPS